VGVDEPKGGVQFGGSGWAGKGNFHAGDRASDGGELGGEGCGRPVEARLTTNLGGAGAVMLAEAVMRGLAKYAASGMPGG